MSSPTATPTFVSVESDKESMSLTYRTEEGNLERFTFGRNRGPLEYQVASIMVSGRGSQPYQEVEVLFKKKGESGVTILTATNAAGVVTDPGITVTHGLKVALTGHDNALRLARQIGEFMDSAA